MITFKAAGAPMALPLLAFCALLLAAPAHSQVATTRNDFKLGGTQPLSLTDSIATPDQCTTCHADYAQPLVEPYRRWQGSMMAQAGRDPMMYAAMAVANQDAGAAGEMCIRCHMPKGWLEGRSVPEDATATTAADREGVQCGVCHRLVDPTPMGDQPAEDAAILAAADPIAKTGNAQMVIDNLDRLRGPFNVTVDLGENPHAPARDTLFSPYHKSAELCGTCHNVIFPHFTRDVNGDYQPNALDTPTTDVALGFPEQSTYDEWLFSAYATGTVDQPQFGRNEPLVSTCQDCHMPAVTGKGASLAPTRDNLPLHTMIGANTFVPKIIPLHPVFGAEVDAAILDEGVAEATDLLRLAATVEVSFVGGDLNVRVTNETGHKLPTGYPDGRRMWLHVRAFDAARQLVLESGRYVFSTADLVGYETVMGDPDFDPDLHVWEAQHGISPTWAATLGLPSGPSFHSAYNNVREFDNRIPPRGFSNAGYATFDGQPVGQAFADGQYWDDVVYPVGEDAVFAEVILYYQTTTREHIEFLRDENVTNSAGPILYDLWDQNGKATPVEMVRSFVDRSSKSEKSCRRILSRLQSKYFKTYYKEWGKCFAVQAAGLTCDMASVDARMDAAQAKLFDRMGGLRDRRCRAASLTPNSLGHPGYCGVPSTGIVLYDMTDMAECSVSQAGFVAGAALAASYGTSPPSLPGAVPSGDSRKCLQSLASGTAKLASAWIRETERCERANASGTNDPVLDCSTDPTGKILTARNKAGRKFSKCTDFSGHAGCGALGSVGAAQTCIEVAVGDVAPGYAEVIYP